MNCRKAGTGSAWPVWSTSKELQMGKASEYALSKIESELRMESGMAIFHDSELVAEKRFFYELGGVTIWRSISLTIL
jgi:hypothetical protein